MNETISPNDMLIGIGYHMPEERRGFKYSARGFPGFFYSRKERFPEVFGGLMFDWNGAYPTCEQLNEAISSLTLSGMLISPISPQTRNYYQFSSAVDLVGKRVLESITQEQAEGLVQLSREFNEEFGEANMLVLG